MAERRLSIYSGPPIEAALACIADEENRSGRLNTICDRYLAMVADELGRLDLSKDEWCAIMDANNGVTVFYGEPAGLMATGIWANVHDSPELGEKWKIDQAALVGKLQRLPRSTLLAVQEACDRFWSRTEQPTDKALAASGIKPRKLT
jgi:hypothetical protein